MDLLTQASNVGNRIIDSGKRVFAPSKANEPSLVAELESMYSSRTFDSVSDYVNFYKSDAFKIAYEQMDPFTCYNLAYSNSWAVGSIFALAKPLSKAPLLPVAKDPEKPNLYEELHLKELLNYPNEETTAQQFRFELAVDTLATGNAYIEVAYNKYGYPCSLYRHYPYLIEKKKGVYVHKNGYRFADDEIIHIKLFNPFSTSKGMSPLVPIVSSLMLDSSIIDKNLKNFKNDALKGLLSIDGKIPPHEAKNEVSRIREQIKEMKRTGQEGHLAAFGVSFQAISTNNREMLTPELQKGVMDRIIAVYGVPPNKLMQIESGNIGGGDGQNQAESMNESLEFWSGFCLTGPLNLKLLRFADIHETEISHTNLTKSDEKRQAEIDDINLKNGSTTLNRVLSKRGEALYEDELADTPFVPNNVVPLGFAGNTNQPLNKNEQSILNHIKQTNPNARGVYIVKQKVEDHF